MYFISLGILTAYTAFVEKGCFAAAKQKDDSSENIWKFTSKQKRYTLGLLKVKFFFKFFIDFFLKSL